MSVTPETHQPAMAPYFAVAAAASESYSVAAAFRSALLVKVSWLVQPGGGEGGGLGEGGGGEGGGGEGDGGGGDGRVGGVDGGVGGVDGGAEGGIEGGVISTNWKMASSFW